MCIYLSIQQHIIGHILKSKLVGSSFFFKFFFYCASKVSNQVVFVISKVPIRHLFKSARFKKPSDQSSNFSSLVKMFNLFQSFKGKNVLLIIYIKKICNIGTKMDITTESNSLLLFVDITNVVICRQCKLVNNKVII